MVAWLGLVIYIYLIIGISLCAITYNDEYHTIGNILYYVVMCLFWPIVILIYFTMWFTFYMIGQKNKK